MNGLTLILGSGGARGLCFIGALQILEENQIPISRVIGTSMGAIIGGAYCSTGTASGLAKQARGLKPARLLFTWPGRRSLLSHRGIRDAVEGIVPARSFSELKIPLQVTATDLLTGQPIDFNTGSLIPPIVGSCLTAGVLEPVIHDGRLLVDGGYTDPFPRPADDALQGIVVVDPMTIPNWEMPPSVRTRRFPISSPRSVYLQALKAMDATLYQLGERILGELPGVRISPELGDMRFTDFRRAEFAIEAGRVATEKALSSIEELLGSSKS